MRRWILMQKCVNVNFRKWRTTPQIWMSGIIIAVFAYWNLSQVVEYSIQCKVRIAPWILPHFFTMPAMQSVFGALTVVLFSAAPFRDAFSQFLEVRVGKEIWIRGQVLYILEASAAYVLYYLLLTIVMILPRIYLTLDWGQLITQLAGNPSDPAQYGITMAGIFFAQEIVGALSAPAAMGLTLLGMWLVSCFLGFLIFACHILFGHGTGILTAGFFSFLAYFSNYVGQLTFGTRILYVSPVNWICLGYWDIYHSGMMPDVWYIIAFCGVGIIILGSLGTRVYLARDDQ